MTVFKRYDGTVLDVPEHKHQLEDTQKAGTTAYASYDDDGFMQKEDRIKLTSLKAKMDYLNDKLHTAVYIDDEYRNTN